METLLNGFTLDIPRGCFPLSTDSMALAWFARLPKNAKVLDLGSGCGTLGILLCARDANCRVTGVELTERAHLAAIQNIRRNGLEHRMESICTDLRRLPSLFPAGSFSAVVSNPPYFSGGPRAKQNPLARHEDCCSMEDLLSAAAWGLKYGGDLFLVHKPERLGEILSVGGKFRLEGKVLTLVRHRPGGDIAMILVRLRKGAKPGLAIREITLTDGAGNPTEDYRSMYHL